MLKHAEITERRIAQFITRLEDSWYTDSRPAGIEFCEEAHADQVVARRGPWSRVEKGFCWGPAWRTVWFRLSGDVPKNWAQNEVVLRAELGGERIVWVDNVPAQGLDEFHKHFTLSKSAPIGKFEVVIQACGNNPDVRVHGIPPQPQALPFMVDRAEYSLFDRERWQFWLDCKFAFDLAQALPFGEPERAHLIRVLNDVANNFEGNAKAAGRVVREALESRSGQAIHTLTPVGHAHLDTAWLWPIHITRKKMAHTTASQLALMNEYPEYVFVHSQAAQYEWLEREYPLLFARVKDMVKVGQWEPLGSMWVEADTNLAGGEALIRQFLYGKKYFKEKFGKDTRDMWLPDVFGYSAAIPQILNKCGIDSFLTQKISWNQFNKFPHNTFWWQGIDGSRVWTHFPPADTYIGQGTPGELRKHLTQHRDAGRSDQALYVFGWGDGGGGPTAQHLEFLRRASKAPGLPAIKWQTAAKFFEEAQRNSRDLQTWVGELYFELHRGTYTTQANNKKHNRRCEFLLRDAEYLACCAESAGHTYPAEELESLWKLVLLNQFHDILPGSSVREVYEDSDLDYAEVYSRAQAIIDKSLRQIAPGAEQGGRAVALFHFAETACQGRLPKAKAKSLICGSEITPVQAIDEWGQQSLVFQVPEAALGKVAAARLSNDEATQLPHLVATSKRMESDTWSVRFDNQGNITSIISLEDQTEYIERGKLGNLFQIFDDQPLFWSAWDVDIYALETQKDLIKSERFEIAETGPVRVAMEIEKRIGSSTLKQRISLGPTPGIRFDTWIDWRESEKMLKVAFPVNVNSARATYEIQYGNVERPTHMNTSWDIARFEVCAHKWVDISEGDHGVALLNDSKYGHDIRNNVMRLTLLRSPKAPDPVADIGIHRFNYVLLPHFGPYNWANVVQAAYALNAKVHSVPISGAGDGMEEPLALCEDRNIVIESVKRAESGKGMIVRVYEAHNSRGSAELSIGRPFKKAHLCDMLENELEELAVDGNTVQFSYKPFEIITIKVR